MKSTLFFPSKNNRFDGQFCNLNSSDMINLRGGGDPPLPPTSGDDVIIDPYKTSLILTTGFTQQPAPVLVETKKPKKKSDKE